MTVKWTGYGLEERSCLARSAIEDTVASNSLPVVVWEANRSCGGVSLSHVGT